MSAVGSRQYHHHYSTHSSATTVSNGSGRRLSTTPYANSPIINRFSDRRLSAIREPYRSPSRSSDDQSTEMITIALAKAQNAVLLDQRNNVTAALDGYSQCCAILAEVIAKETDHDDITRLRQIHDTYSVRMHVLSSMQVDANPSGRQMPPLPMGDDLDEFEDAEDEGYILRSMQYNNTRRDHLPLPSSRRPVDARPFASGRPTLQRSSSSRDSAPQAPRSVPPTRTKPSHVRTSSFTRNLSQMDSLGLLEEIPNTPSSSSTLRAAPKPEPGATLSAMADEEMDDAAFLERITRGFTSDEEILDDGGLRPSTGSSNLHQPKKPSEGFIFENIPLPNRTPSTDFALPSPNVAVVAPGQPSPTPKPTHDRARNTSSPLPQSTLPTPRPSSAKKNLSISGAQPMLKSLSANNAIPNADEIIVPGNPDAAPAIPPKIKKRPHLIRVVSESTMRSNSGARLSTFEMSPGSPPSTGSLLTPGTTNSSSYLTDVPSAKALIVYDREGASPPEDPPEDPYLKPYWLMRALALSMRNQKGAYINTRLFIPQSVWTLKNVKLKAMEEKISSFHAMAAAVKQVLDTDPKNVGLLLQEVQNLEGTMEMVQQNLLRKIDGKTTLTNGTNGDSKPMARKMSQTTLLGGWGKRLRSKSTSSTFPAPTQTSGKETGIDSAYPNATLSLFESALYLEQKFESLDPEDMPIKTQLRLDASRRRIAEFYANVVMRFVLQDVATLMNKHMKKANEWIVS